jgi:arsenate reductase (thioredoxin)
MSVTDPLTAVPRELRPLIRSVADRLHADFSGIFAEETIRRLIADSWESLSGYKVAAFIPLFVERFTRQRLRALARVEGKLTDARPMVVFLCVQNAGRSQMAAGWMQHLAGDDVEVYSGGSDPASVVNPAAIEAMAEVGIDISNEYPKPWTDEVVRAADVIVTMGCGDSCPILPGKRYLDWEVGDPKDLPVEQVRPVRDDIADRVRAIIEELGIPPAPRPDRPSGRAAGASLSQSDRQPQSGR